MQQFKVGDTVWIKGTITIIDTEDDKHPYRVAVDGGCISGNDSNIWVSKVNPNVTYSTEELFARVNEKMKMYHNQNL